MLYNDSHQLRGTTMKRIAICALFLTLTACSGSTTGTNQNTFSVYMDYSAIKTSVFEISTESVHFSWPYSYSSSTNGSLSVSLAIKNISDKTQNISFSEAKATRESTGIDYNATYLSTYNIEPDIVKNISFSITIPAGDDSEKYSFSATFSDIQYTVKLYETPDELRADKTVTYVLDGKEVHKQTVKQGRAIKDIYTYESSDRMSYCSTWNTSDQTKLVSSYKVDDDVTVTGKSADTLSFYNIYISETTPIALQKVNYVYKDGIVVVPERFGGKTVTKVSNFVFYQLSNLSTIYLPKTIDTIQVCNFQNCSNLRTINFAGTKEQWDSISTSSTVPTSVVVRYGVSYIG